jgi:phenylpropionate dioxygenase-like ring-hydroxylating dioxygenase large terminal subunit
MATSQLEIPKRKPDIGSESAAVESFDWENCWYPVSYVQDIETGKPTKASLYDIPLVLFRNAQGELTCLKDICPHRAAHLSDGQIRDGRIECLYHGWQFDADGRCVHIPQLSERINIPDKACVHKYPTVERQGIVWMWAGDTDKADPSLIPLSSDLDRDDVTSVDFQMDLPYDQSYLIENVIDVAHIHIAHHGVRGGGHRDAAKPIRFKIIKNDVGGITSELSAYDAPESDEILDAAVVEYAAPNLIRYTSKYRNADLVSGLDLFSIPLGKSRCRLLYRKYANFTSWRERWKPRWLEHWTQCTILEQDMGVVVGQYEQIERFDGNLRDLWLPLKTSDKLVIEYRKWLDRFGQKLPFYRGFASSRDSSMDPLAERPAVDRFTLHTKICGTCSKIHRNLLRLKTGLGVTAAIFAAIAILTSGTVTQTVFVALALLSLLGILALEPVRSRFEKNQYY